MLKYNELTKRGQIRRLRRLAENALKEFGIANYRLRFLKHLVNTTFVLNCDRGRFLVRIHRVPEHTPERIASELAWLDALSCDTDLVVQAPMKTQDERMVVMAVADGVPDPLPVTILTWVEGRILPPVKRKPRDFVHLGQLVAKLHVHASDWKPPSKPDRRTYDADGVFGTQAVRPFTALTTDDVPREVIDGLAEGYKRLKAVEQSLGRSKEHFGFIHFDLSFSNVLFTAVEARPIDFDECGFGFYL